MKNKKIKLLLFIIILNAAGLFFGSAALAQSEADNLLWGGFESNVQETTGLGNEDPREIVAQVIKFKGRIITIRPLVLIFNRLYCELFKTFSEIIRDFISLILYFNI